MKVTLNNYYIKNYEDRNKKQNSKGEFLKLLEESKPNNNTEIKTSGKRKIEYILEGGMIKVYVSDGKNPPKCIKSIPAKSASKELLAKVKCLTVADALYINDLIESKDDSDEKVSRDIAINEESMINNYD